MDNVTYKYPSLCRILGLTPSSRAGQLTVICPRLATAFIEMSLLITIFLLVFVTQFVTWIGKSVLLDIVCYCYVSYDK
jgi:hypothetical protein